MNDREDKISATFLAGDVRVMPTDDKLKADAGSLVSQYLHFWNEGEVECTVILSRPDSSEVAYATSVMKLDRLRHSLEAVRKEAALQRILIKKHRVVR